MQRSDRSLLAALGALALFVGAQSFRAATASQHRTAAESSGSVATPSARALRRTRGNDSPRERMKASVVELATGVRGMRRDEVRRRLAVSESGTYIGELLLDRDSALTRWPERGDRPLAVWIGGGEGRENWQEDYRAQVRSAFEAWQEVGLPVRFAFVPDSARADVHVTWVDRFAEPISGKTIWSRDDRWWIVDADITLALHHRDGSPLDAGQVRAITLHEIGHLLGLDHTSDATSIMAPRVRVRELSLADQATARLLYSVPAGKLNGD
jgi:hypothetical protein